jgi:hypothetical protein
VPDSRDHRRRVFFYACTAHFNRGPGVCPNGLQARMETVDKPVLASIGEILAPDLVDDIIVRVREILEPARVDDRRERLTLELTTVEAQVINLADAIALGGDLPALVQRLHIADERRQELVLMKK